MTAYPCDQFAADALAVCDELRIETGIEVRFNFPQVVDMVDDIDRAMKARVVTDHDELREMVLGRYAYLHDIEHAAYKRLLERVYKRRMGAKSSMSARNGKFAPKPPIEAYEQ